MSELTDVGSARIGTIDNFEIGYKGRIGKKLSLAVDFYSTSRKGFTDFTGVGPTYMLMGADLVGTWPATVGQDLISDPGCKLLQVDMYRPLTLVMDYQPQVFLLLPQLL